MIRCMLRAASAMKVWVRLVSAMAVLLVLLVAVGLTAAQRIRALNDMLDHYTQSTTPSLQAVKFWQEKLSAIRILQAQHLMTVSAAEMDLLEKDINEAQAQLAASLAEYESRLTGQEAKGFLTYKNSVISSITPSRLDYTFRTVESGKSGSWKTTLYMLMEGAGNISGDAVVLASNAKSFLENLNDNVQRSNTIFQIKKQEAIMVDEEQKLRSLQEEYSALEKKMETNKQAQAAQEKIVASQKSVLDDLKAKN